MSLLARFEKQLEQRGLSIVHTGGENFALKGPNEEKTPEILAACKAMKSLLLEKHGIKKAAVQANNPDNTLRPQKPPVTSCESSTPAATCPILDSPLPTMERITLSQTGWTTCDVCLAEVDETQMKSLPPGMWMEMCGRGMGMSKGEPVCPYHQKSNSSKPRSSK